MNPYQRQRLGILALVATFVLVAGALVVTHTETVESHVRMKATLEFEGRVTSFRVWIQREANELLGTLLALPGTDPKLLADDRTRARAELAAVREMVAGRPDQVARVVELQEILERRFDREDQALAALRLAAELARARGPA